MKVRIKYCGGCNPRYDRKAVVETLRGRFPRTRFIETHEDTPFDLVAVLCGCPAACASHEDLWGLYGKIVASSEEETNAVTAAVNAMMKE